MKLMSKVSFARVIVAQGHENIYKVKTELQSVASLTEVTRQLSPKIQYAEITL